MATSQYKKGTAAPQLPKMAPPMAATVRLTRQREVQGMSETCSPSPGHAAQTASSARALKIPDTSHRDGRPPESEKQLPARRWQRWRVCNRQGETVQCVGDGCYTTGACRPSSPPTDTTARWGGRRQRVAARNRATRRCLRPQRSSRYPLRLRRCDKLTAGVRGWTR